jgi:hypothetical protein
MKKVNLIWLLITLGMITSSGQAVKKCDISILGQIDSNIENLTQKEIEDFLLTFDASCHDNVEYSEFSNELLFTILDKHTLTILTVLENKRKDSKIEEILNGLSSPVNDSFNIEGLISRVSKIIINNELREQLIARLNRALK